MRKNLLITALVLIFSLGLVLGAAGQANAASPSINIAAGQSRKTLPRTDGKTIVWGDSRNGTTAIYGANVVDGKEFPIVTGMVGFPDIDNGNVVWQQDEPCPSCKQEIYLKNLATGKVNDLGLGFNPKISGNYVAYIGASNNKGEAIQVRDISTMAAPVTLAQTGPISVGTVNSFASIDFCFAFDGNRALWSEEYIDAERIGHYKVNTIRIGETSPTLIDQGIGTQTTCDLHGDTLVYDKYLESIKVVNLATGERQSIGDYNLFPSYVGLRPYQPRTDGRYIFFEKDLNTYRDRLDLYGYDIATKSYFEVDTDGNYNDYPAFKNGVLVWLKNVDHFDEKDNRLHAAYISTLLPNTPQPQIPNTADRAYFKETEHTLAYAFKNFWEKNGGLAVFGFPQTEEFQELNADTGKVYTVQYFERQRYEYHPENQGTPYDVLLGRLGAADAQNRGLLSTAPFQKITATNDSNCLYFLETGHKACGSFLAYWQSHRLDLGDAGTAFQESLALFGFPISEEFTDPATGLTTQYFERAKFEYQPENKNTPYEVLLGLLGNQEVVVRGWH